jgi:alpha-methylacyl-CoA racemase
MSRAEWPGIERRLAETFASQPREHWTSLFAGTDA